MVGVSLMSIENAKRRLPLLLGTYYLLLLSRMPLLLCWKGLLWVRGRAVNCKISSPHSPPSELWVWELNTLSFSEAQFFGQNWWRLDDENVKKIFFLSITTTIPVTFFQKNNRWCLRVAADTNKTSITAFCLEVSSISIGIVWLTI